VIAHRAGNFSSTLGASFSPDVSSLVVLSLAASSPAVAVFTVDSLFSPVLSPVAEPSPAVALSSVAVLFSSVLVSPSVVLPYSSVVSFLSSGLVIVSFAVPSAGLSPLFYIAVY
jgi:hypothetical protein